MKPPTAATKPLDAEDIPLARSTLNALNKLTGRESDREVSAIYAQWRTEQENGTAIALKRREKQSGVIFAQSADDVLRASLRRLGYTPAENEPNLAARLEELETAAAVRANEEYFRTIADRNRRKAESIFRAAGCPERHTLNMDAMDEGQNPRWLATRDLLVEQAGYANGFLVALLGGRGVGKTQMAVSLLHRCAGRLMTCKYTKALNLFRDLRRAYAPVARGQAGETESDIIAEWVSYDLLIVDEAHQRGETLFEQNTLINLLDQRYDRRACTIVIANQSDQEFSAAMGDSLVSRIYETGAAIVCDWPSFRTPGKWRQTEGAAIRVPKALQAKPLSTKFD